MERLEILRQQRERIINRLKAEDADRAKLLVTLMDIDDEMEEMGKAQMPSLPPLKRRFTRKKLSI